jgi:DNA-binding MarR family transcriptional regulator
MQSNESRRIARYIFTNGKVIQDKIIRWHTMQVARGSSKSMYKEVTMSQLHTIMSIYNRGEVSMTELSALTNVSPPSASVMVDRLVEKGILVREHSERDRRKVMVKISPKAVKGIRQIEEGILQSFTGLVEDIGPETAQKWCDVIEKVKTVLEKENSRESGLPT